MGVGRGRVKVVEGDVACSHMDFSSNMFLALRLYVP